MTAAISIAFDSDQRSTIQAGCFDRGAVGAGAGTAQNNACLTDAKLTRDFKLAGREQHGAAKAVVSGW